MSEMKQSGQRNYFKANFKPAAERTTVRLFICRCFPVVMILLLMSSLPALAIPAITCHCFSERSYDPARPAAADQYFLAMAQNAFFAGVFAVDKKTIIIKKQTGTSSDDLWVAYRIAAESGVAAEQLLEARTARGSWGEAVASLAIPAKVLGAEFSSALHARLPDERLAEIVVNELFAEYRLLAATDVAALRKSGATNQELILAGIIARRTKKQAPRIYQEVKSGARSWGALLQEARIEPAEMPKEVSALLKIRR